jgi:class 3 adenylate cyclase/predicted ATPase
MTCTACGAANPAGRKFCGECGARLALACTSCGAALETAQKFCGECGAAAAAPGAGSGSGSATSAPQAGPSDGARTPLHGTPVAERRLVSVLFADLVGFTPFAEERDSEDVRETLTRYFDIARETIDRHGGTVEKFIGDAVMAVWGTPTAHEDDAERAVRAALQLLDAVHALGDGIQARAAVLTGEAAVTLGNTSQGMVAGDLVNTAARLQGAAAPGTVLVGETTYRAASAAIAFEEAGEHTLKGKASPVPAWRALRVVGEVGGRHGRAELLEPPFTGRDDELRTLKDQFHATSRERRARLVSVTGPAGIGKSRLAWEFEKYADGVVERVWWHHGRSPSYGQGIAFWALGEMVRSRCRLMEGADEATTRAHVADTLAEHITDAAERAWVEPAILALLGIGTTAVAADELFARWRVLFERMALTGTVVLVFEDLHWADGGTLDFIDHLLDWARQLPILVVTMARPELLVHRPEWGAGRRSFLALPLDPLPDAAMRTLLAGLVPDLPADAVRRIIERAEGIPLYAVETVRMLVAEKRLVLDGRTYKPTGDIEALAVPETLTALIAARLDALDPTDRTLVLDAAVIGQRFTLEALAAVSGQEPAVIEPRLRALVRRELLTLEADPRSPERGQYGFVQAMIREVAYNTLARRDRKERHLATARHFESLGSDELAGALAIHYLSARENAAEGPEADALAAQARVALRGAAERAVALGSYEQSADLLKRALDVAASPLDRADLLERFGLAASAAGRMQQGAASLAEAAAILLEHSDRPGAVRALAESAQALVNAKQLPAARALLEQALADYADLGADPSMIRCRSQLARVLMLGDDPAASVAVADAALADAEAASLGELIADTLITKGSSLGYLGRVFEGTALLTAAERYSAANGLNGTRLRALHNLSVGLADFDPRAAVQAIAEGMVLARRIGATAMIRQLQGNLGYLRTRIGAWDDAERDMSASLNEAMEPADELVIVNNLVSVRAFRGQPTDDIVARLDALRGGLPDAMYEGFRLDTVAITHLAAGRIAQAVANNRAMATMGPSWAPQARLFGAALLVWLGDGTQAAEEIAEFDALRQRAPGLDANRDAVLAGIAALAGRTEEAVRGYADAHRRLTEIGLTLDAALVGIGIAGVVGAEQPETAAIIETTRVTLERLRATALLTLLDQALAKRQATGTPV